MERNLLLFPALLDFLCSLFLFFVVLQLTKGTTRKTILISRALAIVNLLRTTAQVVFLAWVVHGNPGRALLVSQLCIFIQFSALLTACRRISRKREEERERQNSSLVDAEIRFLSIIENAPEAIALVDTEGKFVLTNKRLHELTGFPEQETFDRSFLDLVHPDDRDSIRSFFRDQIRGLRDQYRYRARFLCANDRVAWGDISSTVIRNEDGSFHYGVGIVSDVTALVSAEQESQEALIEKERVILQMHHRIKNNIQIIASLLALEDGKMETPTARLSLEKTLDRVRSIALAHELASSSIDQSSVNLQELARELVSDMEYASYSVTAVQTHIGGEEVTITLDQAIPIAIILTELIANAHIHAFSEAGKGELSIETFNRNGEQGLRVSDDGKGLDFDPTETRAQDEGLNIIQALISQLEGELRWHTDRGLRCEITFPHIHAERARPFTPVA